MRTVRLPLATEQAEALETMANSRESLVNLQLQAMEHNPFSGRTRYSLVSTPGMRPWASSGHSGRAMSLYRMDSGRVIAVCEHGFYEVAGGSLVRLDPVNEGPQGVRFSRRQGVSVAGSGDKLVAVRSEGALGWIVSEDSGALSLSRLTGMPASMGVPDQVVRIGRYFVFGDGRRFYVSGLDNPASVGHLDYSQPQGDAGDITALFEDHGQMLVFGSRTVEFWGLRAFVDPEAPFPLELRGSYSGEVGTTHPLTLAKTSRGPFWVSENSQVFMLRGRQAVRVSTAAVEEGVEGDLAESVEPLAAFSYEDAGHTCYVLRTGRRAFVYDLETGRWHTRSTDVQGYAAACALRTSDGILMGGGLDILSGSVMVMDRGRGIEGDIQPKREMVLPTMEPGAREWVRIAFLNVRMRTGDADMAVGLRVSRDRGRTWGNEMVRKVARGDNSNVVRFHGLGAMRSLTARVSIRGPSFVEVLGVDAGVA